MTAVMVRADERRSAAIVSTSSMKLSFTGGDVDWMTKMSLPRTESCTTIDTSPSAKRLAVQRPHCMSSLAATSAASSRFEQPAKMCSSPWSDGSTKRRSFSACARDGVS
jgi:hypothetical protein